MDVEFLTVDELAKVLKTPTSWIYQKSRETGPNAIPMIKCGKYNRYVLDDVLGWLERRNKDRS